MGRRLALDQKTIELSAAEGEISPPGITIYSGLNPVALQPYVDGKVIPQQPSVVGTQVPTIYGSSKFLAPFSKQAIKLTLPRCQRCNNFRFQSASDKYQ